MSYPQFSRKHRYAPLFQAADAIAYEKRVGRKMAKRVPPIVVFCYNKWFFQHLQKAQAVSRECRGVFGKLLIPKDNSQIGIMGEMGIGAPELITRVEELIASGVRQFIILGKAGGLQSEFSIGNVVVCDRAIRDEGTSHHYVKSGKYGFPSSQLLSRIKSGLDRDGITYSIGTSWTIDAPYRETRRELRHYQSQGVLTVEMEASALFIVAKVRRVQAAAVFIISDSVAGNKWKPKFHILHQQAILDKVYSSLVQTL